MKKFSFFAVAAMAILAISCNKEENGGAAPEIDWQVPEASVLAGKAVNFADNTLDVASRTWTFQDGKPATSTDAAVTVTFATAGDKAVTLEVTFKNGKTNKKEATIKVVEPLDGEIAVSATTPMGCIRIGQEVTFSLANATGNPETYAWTFEGGNPATSTEAAPKVTFPEHIREMHVSCVASRADGAKLELEKTYEVGNYTLNKAWPDAGYDGVSFEDAVGSNWICWITSNCNDVFSIADGGACGTAHSLKIDATKIAAAADQQGWGGDIFPRDSWACNAPKIEKDKNYEVSFWMKVSSVNPEMPLCVSAIMVIGWLEDWMNDPVFGAAGESFTDVMGVDFTPCGNKTAFALWPGSAEEAAPLIVTGTDWTNVKLSFTAPEDMYNVYPYLRIPVGLYDYAYIDEIEVNLIED